MHIDSGQLGAFAAVLRAGSFEGAARHLNVTPSAISQRIKQLEERLGQVLIQRSAPCRPTAAGKVLARYAEQQALLEAETLHELHGTAATVPTTVRVPLVVNADSLESWFLAVFDTLDEAPAICLEVTVEDQDHSLELLREGTVIAAVTADGKAVQGCRVVPLGAMRYRAVASPAFVARHFAGGVNADSLACAPMLLFSSKDALQDRYMAHYAPHPLSPPTHRVPSAWGFIALAQRGVGWGMVPEIMAAGALARGELCEIAPRRPIDVPLYWQHWRLKSTVMKRLTRCVEDAARAALQARPETLR